jgi:hypothetical protein
MRRPLLFTLAALLVALLAAPPAVARKGAIPAGSYAFGASLLTWAQRYDAWSWGSSTNPLLNDICGEKVGKVFFLNAALEPGTEVDCHFRPGTRLVGTPGGVIAWAPTDGQTREELVDSRDSFLAAISDPRATLDGHSLGNLDDTLRLSDVYTIPLEPGNFIQTVDPDVPGDETQVATADWVVRLRPLTPGHHELVFSDRVFGDLLDITFHITVHKGNRK